MLRDYHTTIASKLQTLGETDGLLDATTTGTLRLADV
jgi:hypothetical protein